MEETEAVTDSSQAPESTPTETTTDQTPDATPESSDPAAPAAYQPNYSFKVMDKDHEIPEWARPTIKDAASEKQAREVFEKAFGLDHVKPKYESLKAQHDALMGEYKPIQKDLEILSTLISQNDVGGISAALGLTDEQIIKYALERIEYHQMPPEKKHAMDAQRQQTFNYYKTQQELNELKSQKANDDLNGTYNELMSAVQAPHIQSIAESFNARAGRPNAFEQAVIAHAQSHFALTKQDLSVPQAIESFVRTFGLQASQPTAQPGAPASATPGQRAATLPKSGSGTVSPVKPKVTNLADLRKLQQAAYESQ